MRKRASGCIVEFRVFLVPFWMLQFVNGGFVELDEAPYEPSPLPVGRWFTGTLCKHL